MINNNYFSQKEKCNKNYSKKNIFSSYGIKDRTLKAIMIIMLFFFIWTTIWLLINDINKLLDK